MPDMLIELRIHKTVSRRSRVLTCDAESLVGTASQIFHCFEDNFARMVRESFLIFNVPSQCAEEWRHKIDTGLRREITPGQVMRAI